LNPGSHCSYFHVSVTPKSNYHTVGTITKSNYHTVGTVTKSNYHTVGTVTNSNYHTVGTVTKSNYHTVGTVTKSNMKTLERSKIGTRNTQIHKYMTDHFIGFLALKDFKIICLSNNFCLERT
jgi:hypothetical protein